MDCRRYRTIASRELDGECGDDERFELARHIDSCAACRAFRELAREAASLHRASPEIDPSPRLVASILREAGGTRAFSWKRRWLALAVPAASAAVFVLGFWVGSLMHEQYGGVGVSTTASEVDGLGLEYLDESPPGSVGNVLAASYEGGDS